MNVKLATLLIIVLSNRGYWISGQTERVNLHSAVQGGLPGAELIYELRAGAARIDNGRVALAGDQKEAVVPLNVPRVRVRITLHWVYRLVARDGGKELETGDVPISIFPDDLMNGVASRMGNKRLIVWDDPAALPKLLDKAKVPYLRVSSAGKLQFEQGDVVLVGADQLDSSPFAQTPLLNLARAGASVMIFEQTRPPWLFGWALTTRKAPAKLDWRLDHPLLAGFESGDVQSWIADVSALKVVQLPADEPALEVASFPREEPGGEPAPIDAVLVTRSIGKGRIVLCQLPLGDWNTDPRSQILLSNAMDYLLTRPGPTPRPSQRPITRPVVMKPIPTIPIPGDHP
jgi:hypothetical protein